MTELNLEIEQRQPTEPQGPVGRETPRRRSFLTGAAALAVGAAAGAAAVLDNPPAAVRAAAAGNGRRRGRFNAIPNVEVTSHDGETFRFYDDLIKDKVVTVNFFYALCGTSCPLITANLRKVQEMFGERVGRDLHMYSITLQPEFDTPESLKAYVKQYDIGPGWKFLTGKPTDVEKLRRAFGFTDPNPELDILADTHTGMVRYGNDRLKRWAGMPALARAQGIVYSIRTSVLDAGVGGAPVRPGVPYQHQPHHHG
jgi:protein SCO1/2